VNINKIEYTKTGYSNFW